MASQFWIFGYFWWFTMQSHGTCSIRLVLRVELKWIYWTLLPLCNAGFCLRQWNGSSFQRLAYYIYPTNDTPFLLVTEVDANPRLWMYTCLPLLVIVICTVHVMDLASYRFAFTFTIEVMPAFNLPNLSTNPQYPRGNASYSKSFLSGFSHGIEIYLPNIIPYSSNKQSEYAGSLAF